MIFLLRTRKSGVGRMKGRLLRKSVAQLYAAMAYYHEHRAKMDAKIDSGARHVDRLRVESQPAALRRSDLEARIARQ